MIQESSNETKTIEKTIIERDTVFNTKTDSTFYNALIECQNGIPILKNPTVTKSADAKVDVDVMLDGNQLKVKATKEAEQMFLKWKEEYTKENSTKETKIPYPVYIDKPVPLELTWWQDLWIKIGKLSVVSFTLYALIKIPWLSLTKRFFP
ncbi:hypothetical protein [Epilithonimonas mollis]|uniref:Uncharacterized protein n=1 Tax=Epilithonimonas mollis TaxID=216903 RepID=A0A1M6UKL8_9FLAO|nr:hypothetical protein [Epilithonimonas mollis]SHK69785.1 hypothetical protein SAMN05444371_3357 [Epilithonimonas mollis]